MPYPGKAVVMEPLDGGATQEYPSIYAAARALGTYQTNIRFVLNGRRSTHRGAYWIFKDEQLNPAITDIARGLTDAQRRAIIAGKCEGRGKRRCIEALSAKGLAHRWPFALTPRGIAVRIALKGEQNAAALPQMLP